MHQEFEAEVLVIGAGLIGSSVAMHLAAKGVENVRVVDFDLEGSLSSSELNAGGVRATWLQPVNVRTSQASIEYYTSVADEVGYKDCGYLWLHTPERLSYAVSARDRQVEMGWPVEVWDVSELRRRVPFIDKTDDVAGAIFSPRDGLINPNLLKNHFRAKAKARGVKFDDRTMVRQAEYTAQGVVITAEKFTGSVTPETKLDVLSGKRGGDSWDTVKYRVKRVVNCAGAWAPQIATILGYPCPSHPLRRQVAIFDCRDVDLTQHGMIIDTSGVYFHHEASNGLAGFAIPNEVPGINYNYDGETFFNEYIWPALYERSSGFEALKHLTGWAGLYEVSPDESAIIGEVELGDPARTGRVFESHSFSGRGAMHSYGAGLALAERMALGRYETVDVSELSGNRFAEGRMVPETLVI